MYSYSVRAVCFSEARTPTEIRLPAQRDGDQPRGDRGVAQRAAYAHAHHAPASRVPQAHRSRSVRPDSGELCLVTVARDRA